MIHSIHIVLLSTVQVRPFSLLFSVKIKVLEAFYSNVHDALLGYYRILS
jgi:hypothetical protein